MLFVLQAAQSVNMEKQENSYTRNCDAKQLCSVIRKELAEEMARAGMGNNLNSAGKCRTMAVLKSTLRLMKQ